MFLMEQPLTIIFGGAVLVAAIFGGFIQTGRRSLAVASAVVLALTMGLLALERLTLTPREEVRATLHVIAADLERNDVQAVIQHVSSGRPKIRQAAKRNMERVEIVSVDIKRNLTVELLESRGEELAQASFNCVLKVKGGRKSDVFAGQEMHVPRHFVVSFRREDGHWRVRDYEMNDPRQGMTRIQ